MADDNDHDAFGEELEEKVTCWVCFELMDEPLTLPCSHSFCKECCVKVYKKDACCPFCRRPFGVPLPVINAVLQALVKRVKAQLDGKNPGKDEPVAMIIEQDSVLLALPDEVLVSIFMHLPYQQLCKLSRVSRDINRVSDDGFLWRTFCNELFPFVVSETGDWKKTFSNRQSIGKRWETGKAGDFKVTTMRGHTNYISVFDLYRHNIVSGSADCTLKLWRVNSDKAIHTCNGHNGTINAVRFNEIYIASGSADNTAKIWDTTAGVTLHTLAHNGPVTDLGFDGNTIVTSSTDRLVRVWDIRQGTCSQSIPGHNGPIDHILLGSNNKMISSDSANVHCWDTRVVGPGRSLWSRQASTKEIALTNDKVISAGHDGFLRAWSLNNGTVAFQTNTHVGPINSMKVDATRIVSGGPSDVVVTSLATGAQLRRIANAHAGGVFTVQFDDQKILSGGADNSIKVWKLDNGQSMYALLGGTLQARGNNPPHPQRPGCSFAAFDDSKVIASFNSLMRVYNFEGKAM